MAGSVNKVILIGNLGADPEVRRSTDRQTICNFRIATTDRWTDKGGVSQERTEWHRIVTFGKTAENCGQYLTKGRQVYVEGRLQTREWTDKENQKRYTTEVVAQQVTFLGSREGGGARPRGGEGPEDYGPPPDAEGAPPAPSDDIPF